MKTKKEIERELENVTFYLQSEFWEDWRVHLWEGYRDALQWVLDIVNVTSKDKDIEGITPKYKIKYR